MTATAAIAMTPGPLWAHLDSKTEHIPLVEDPQLRQLIQIAIDTARSAGATYADVRLTHLKKRNFSSVAPARDWGWSDQERITVGVRALVDGYWGFASGPIWNQDEMKRLGRTAVRLARTNALGKPRHVEMAPAPVVEKGHWETPVRINPFEVPQEEICDVLASFYSYASRLPKLETGMFSGHSFTMTEKAFGSTDGSYVTQRLFRSGQSGGSWKYRHVSSGLGGYLSQQGQGWELYLDQPLREYLRHLYEELKEDASFPIQPVDVGRYDAVIDAHTIATVLSSSIGAATQFDRTLGYEANAGGTSYITDPKSMLGELRIGSSVITVSANRNAPGAAATVRWDDEGVEPEAFTLVRNGILVGFQTARESAGWMNTWQMNPATSRSHGCASAREAVDVQLIHTPNLAMTPARESQDMASLVAEMDSGIVIKRGYISMDFQQLNGYGSGEVYEVRKGKRTAMYNGAGIIMRAPEFWNSIHTVGGPQSVKRYAGHSLKGEPEQQEFCSVDAVPVQARNITIIDRLRKA